MALENELPLDSEMVLPPNNEGGDISNNIDNATIGTFNPGNQAGVPNTDVQRLQMANNPLGGQQMALPNATNEMFTPGVNQPLRVGQSGGRDIFVAQNQTVPFALLERRRAAQQAAALKRAQDLKANQKELGGFNLSKDQRFNKNLLKTGNEFISSFEQEALKQAGGDKTMARQLLTDTNTDIGRQFATQMSNLNQVTGQFDQIVDDVASIEKRIEDGDTSLTPEDYKFIEDYNKMGGAFESGDIFNTVNFAESQRRLTAQKSLPGVVKSTGVLDKIMPKVLGTSAVYDAGSGRWITKDVEKKDYDKAVQEITNQLMEVTDIRRQGTSRESVEAYVGSLLQDSSITKKKNQFAPGAGKGLQSKKDVVVDKNKRVTNIEGTNFESKNSTTYPESTQKKVVSINSPAVVGKDGNVVTQEGAGDYRVLNIETITTRDGVERDIVHAKQVFSTENLTDDEKLEKGYEKNPLTGKYDNMPDTYEEDVVLDYGNVKESVQSIDNNARYVGEAYDDQVSTKQLDRVTINPTNIDVIEKGFNESGLTNINDYIAQQKRNGTEYIMTDEAKQRIEGKSKKQKEVLKKRVAEISPALEKYKIVTSDNVEERTNQAAAIEAFMINNGLTADQAVKLLKENKRL